MTESPRQHAPPEVRRAQILDAALRCFAERGYHAATMDDLVRASGLSKGSLYWHFRSKEEVFLALFDRFTEELFGDWDQEVAAGSSGLELLRRGFDDFLERLIAQGPALGAWVEFMAHPVARARFAQVYRESRAKLAAILSVSVERGEVRDLPLEGMAAGIVAGAEGLLLQALVDPEFDPRAHWPVVWQGITKGYAA
jgi:AcrR family transcriptional regulator